VLLYVVRHVHEPQNLLLAASFLEAIIHIVSFNVSRTFVSTINLLDSRQKILGIANVF